MAANYMIRSVTVMRCCWWIWWKWEGWDICDVSCGWRTWGVHMCFSYRTWQYTCKYLWG